MFGACQCPFKRNKIYSRTGVTFLSLGIDSVKLRDEMQCKEGLNLSLPGQVLTLSDEVFKASSERRVSKKTHTDVLEGLSFRKKSHCVSFREAGLECHK